MRDTLFRARKRGHDQLEGSGSRNVPNMGTQPNQDSGVSQLDMDNLGFSDPSPSPDRIKRWIGTSVIPNMGINLFYSKHGDALTKFTENFADNEFDKFMKDLSQKINARTIKIEDINESNVSDILKDVENFQNRI